jgi:hypothetical protein
MDNRVAGASALSPFAAFRRPFTLFTARRAFVQGVTTTSAVQQATSVLGGRGLHANPLLANSAALRVLKTPCVGILKYLHCQSLKGLWNSSEGDNL